MQLIITDGRLAQSRAIHLSGTRLVLAFVGAALALMLLAAALYHWVFLKGAREGWPVVGTVVRLMVRDEFEQRDRFLRENLDAMARRVGEMQARLLQLEALGDRVSGLAGVNPRELKTAAGQGGVLVTPRSLTLDELQPAPPKSLTVGDFDHNGVPDIYVVEARADCVNLLHDLAPDLVYWGRPGGALERQKLPQDDPGCGRQAMTVDGDKVLLTNGGYDYEGPTYILTW